MQKTCIQVRVFMQQNISSLFLARIADPAVSDPVRIYEQNRDWIRPPRQNQSRIDIRKKKTRIRPNSNLIAK